MPALDPFTSASVGGELNVKKEYKNALEEYKDDIIRFAESEGLGAHAKSATIRFDK